MAPKKAWSNKDERQYEHIKESEQDRGRSEDRAEEIAARTVNKQRSKEGRTEQRSSGSKGSGGGRLEDRTVEALRARASDLNIKGRSGMKKEALIRAIREANG